MDNYKIEKFKRMCMEDGIGCKIYTLYSDLNNVSLYESERTREEIFIRIKGDNMSTF